MPHMNELTGDGDAIRKITRATSQILSQLADILELQGTMTIAATVARNNKSTDADLRFTINGSIALDAPDALSEAFPVTGTIAAEGPSQ
jgi:hypothetical protein